MTNNLTNHDLPGEVVVGDLRYVNQYECPNLTTYRVSAAAQNWFVVAC